MIKTCRYCIHRNASKNKKTEVRVQVLKDGTKKVFPQNPRIDDYCARKHDLKFGIIDCEDFERVKPIR
jgi:hypothetical protein